MTAQQQAAAILARIDPALGSDVAAYDLDRLPSPRPSDYVEITVSRRFGGARRLGNQTGIAGYRLTIRAVSQTSVANVRNALEKCRAELEFAPVVVGGVSSTGVQFETEDPAAEDEGWFSGLMAFTYTTKESL